MSLRAPASLLVLLVATAAWPPQVAHADRPTSPPRLVEGCKRDPQSALCREVRRLCATKAVRDEVVPACKELGWWGDTTYREITNLCPIDPTHADCQSTKAACESQRAASLGDDGEKICREMGWGAYAYTNLAPEGNAGDGDANGAGGDGAGDGEGEANDGDGEAEERAARGEGFVDGHAGAAPGAPSAAARLLLPTWAAGVEGLGVRLGFVDDAADLGDHDALYTAHLDATVLSFARLPVALGFVGDLGVAASSDVAYQADLLLGLGRWWTPHLAAGVLGGAGVSGIGGGGAPFAIDLPVRLVGIAHAGDRVSVEGWAQLTWFASTEASRGAGSPSVGFADAAELGGALVWGTRAAANGGFGAGLWLGGLYQEQNGTRIVSIMVGLGAARNPWVR
jgi:hypothetical protein